RAPARARAARMPRGRRGAGTGRDAASAARCLVTRRGAGLLSPRASNTVLLAARRRAALAAGAPVGDAIVVAQAAGADRRAAAGAGPAGAPVDAALGTRTGDGPAHEPARLFQHPAQVVVRRLADAKPRRELRPPQRLR